MSHGHRYFKGRRSAKSVPRHQVYTKFVVIDIAGNPLACFDTIEEATEAVQCEFRGRRIVEQAFTDRGGDMRMIGI